MGGGQEGSRRGLGKGSEGQVQGLGGVRGSGVQEGVGIQKGIRV